MKTCSMTTVLIFLAASTASAEPITPIAEVRRGEVVTVQGTIERITDEDEFRLADDSGEILIYVGPYWVPAAVGETVIVHGIVDDDPGSHEIYARSLERLDGSLFSFEHSYE